MEELLNIPNKDSSSNHWIEWHRALRKRYTRSQANTTFELAWNKYGTDDANDDNLRDYLNRQGYQLEPNFTDQVFDAISYPFQAWSTVFWIGVIISILIVITLIWAIAKNPDSIVKLGAFAATKNPTVLAK